MILDLTQQITQAQIAFGLMIISVAVTYYVFTQKPTKADQGKKK